MVSTKSSCGGSERDVTEVSGSDWLALDSVWALVDRLAHQQVV